MEKSIKILLIILSVIVVLGALMLVEPKMMIFLLWSGTMEKFLFPLVKFGISKQLVPSSN